MARIALMHTGLNLLLAAGILANLVKGGDLVLRTSQKKALQDRFETLTLWLDDLRPVQWLSYLPMPKPAFWWSTFSAIFAILALLAPDQIAGGALAFVLDLILNSVRALATAQGMEPRFFNPALTAGALLAIPASVLVLVKLSRPLIGWLVGNGGFWRFLGKMVLFYAGSVAILAAFWWLCRVAGGSLLAALALAAAWPFTFIIYFLNTTGMLIVTLYLFIRPFAWLVKFMGAICWRIVEYSQGVFAALLLISTVLLGVVIVVLNSK